MLRRDFIKTASLTVGGLILTGSMVMANKDRNSIPYNKFAKPVYKLNGYGRNGCASPPDFQNMMESGISALPWM